MRQQLKATTLMSVKPQKREGQCRQVSGDSREKVEVRNKDHTPRANCAAMGVRDLAQMENFAPWQPTVAAPKRLSTEAEATRSTNYINARIKKKDNKKSVKHDLKT